MNCHKPSVATVWIRFITIPFVAFLLLIALAPEAAAADKNVLLIYNDKSTAQISNYGRIVASALEAGSANNINFYEEYPDLWKFAGDDYEAALSRYYRQKYLGQKFDLLIAQSVRALTFLSKYGDEIFPGTPIVFGATDKFRFEERHAELKPNITGVLWDYSFAGTVDVALKLQPETRRVVVVSGASESDLSYLAHVRAQLQKFENRVEFSYLAGRPLDEIGKSLASEPGRSIILYIPFFRDGAGKAFTPPETLSRLAKAQRGPLYVLMDSLVNLGAFGGFVASYDADATEVAKLALRVLAGEKPSDIPVRVATSNHYVFDWRQLRRWGIEEQRLPPGSTLLFKDTTWELYRWRIIGAISLSVVQALLIVGLLINRRQRRRAEETRNRLAAIVESTDDAILSEDLEGRVTGWNAGAQRIYGYPAAEIVGRDISTLAPEELNGEPAAILEHLRRHESVRQLETVQVTRDGRRIDVSLTTSPIRNRKGRVVGASIIARDVTDRKRADRELRDSEERFRRMADTAPVMIYVCGPDALCNFVNQRWLEFTGRTMEQEMGNGWTEGLHPSDYQSCLDVYMSAFKARRTFTMEYRHRRADGQYRWLVDTGGPSFRHNGEFVGYIGTCLDVTDRKHHEQVMNNLTGRILLLQDEERRRVAAELHDSLGQSLAIIKNRALIALRDRSNQDRAIEQLQEISDTVSVAIVDVRNIAHNLRPYELDRLGLAAAIESMIERVSSSTNIQLSQGLEHIDGLLSPEAETSVYRIVQEGLSNIIKHAHATTARIEIRRLEEQLIVSIEDNGDGIRRPAPASNGESTGGLGLEGIAARVRGLNGSFEIDSKPTRGTTLTIRLELSSVCAR